MTKRKIIIDTDTAGDDAAAIMLAVKTEDVEILGITIVNGNVPLNSAAANALMTLELCGAKIPVYNGSARPLVREPLSAVSVYGSDGMGEKDLIHPAGRPEDKHAVDFIIEMAKKYPGELEIVELGPATNIALAIMRDREAMRGIKGIFSMGTGGFSLGNATPVAEFNVYTDAEAYSIMLKSGIPLTIAGFDLCVGSAAFDDEEMARIEADSPLGALLISSTSKLLEFNINRNGVKVIDLPDAIAMGIALWKDIILESVPCYCHCCTVEEETYGQVVVYETDKYYEGISVVNKTNAHVVKRIETEVFKQRFMQLLK